MEQGEIKAQLKTLVANMAGLSTKEIAFLFSFGIDGLTRLFVIVSNVPSTSSNKCHGGSSVFRDEQEELS